MEESIGIVDAGNCMVPAYLVLKAKGFRVWNEEPDPSSGNVGEVWFAERPDLSLIADGPVSLLGLLAMFEARGADWKADDKDIEAFLAAHYPSRDSLY